MSREELLRLAERVEALSGPDRDVDVALAPLLGLRVADEGHPLGRCCYDENGAAVPLPRPTSSLDAAMTLVGDGRDLMVDNFDGPHDRRCSASVFNAPGSPYADYEAFAATPALALCAAALKARANQEPGQ